MNKDLSSIAWKTDPQTGNYYHNITFCKCLIFKWLVRKLHSMKQMNKIDIIEYVTLGYFTMSDVHENPGVLIPFIFYASMETFILIGIINWLIEIL